MRQFVDVDAARGDVGGDQHVELEALEVVERALAEFKSNKLQVLVATDIAARGIDIDQLPHVVNYDLPNVPEDYVHRIGRTGRAGASGEAISLVCLDEELFLRDIERLIKREIPREVLPGFEPDPNARPEPIQTGSRGQGQGGRRGGPPRPSSGGGAGKSAKAPSRRTDNRTPGSAPARGGPAPAGRRPQPALLASNHRSGGRGR